MTVRKARSGEATALSALALRSKASWGYPAELVARFRDELTLCDAQLAQVRVAEMAAELLGFHSLERLPNARIELGHLFVEPHWQRRGLGTLLLRDAMRHALALGAEVLVIQGDPYAAGFYRAMGALQIGERESDSVPGRMLPLFELHLR